MTVKIDYTYPLSPEEWIPALEFAVRELLKNEKIVIGTPARVVLDIDTAARIHHLTAGGGFIYDHKFYQSETNPHVCADCRKSKFAHIVRF